jgi:hypothetical protein
MDKINWYTPLSLALSLSLSIFFNFVYCLVFFKEALPVLFPPLVKEAPNLVDPLDQSLDALETVNL